MSDDRPLPTGASFWAVDDEPFVRALVERLLPERVQSMPRILVRGLPPAQETRARRLRRHTLAFVRPHDPHIYVNRWTDVFREAKAGNEEAAKVLAAIFAHEQAHVTGGPDEDAAYKVGLDVLTQLGATPASVRRWQQAWAATVPARR